MSLGSRATKGGAKGNGTKSEPKDKPKVDKPQPKEKVKPQATTEQLRMANMIDRKNEDASDVRRMVLELMEMTCRTEEEVCSALHDCDNDMVAACNLLLEDTQRIQGEWQTSEKKKKKPPATVTNNGEPEPPARDPRSRSGPRTRRGEGEGRGRGAMRGRGARGVARGGRGGRRGGAPRSRPSREETSWDDPTDTGGNPVDSFPTTEDWDNEEWSGSLSDTKVFTPSASAQTNNDIEVASNSQEDWDSAEVSNGPTDHIATYIYNSTHAYAIMDQMNAAPPVEPAPQEVYHAPHHQPIGLSGTLTAAQSQYLSQLTQQSQMSQQSQHNQTPLSQPPMSQPQLSQTQLSQPQLSQTQHSQPQLSQTQNASQPQLSQTQPPLVATQPHQPLVPQQPALSQPSHYSTYNANYYGAEVQRKPLRARVPPPSKIPSSAVEMPGGGESSGAMFLDVQFGALEPETLNDTPVQSTATKQPTQPQAPPPSQSKPEPAPAPAPPTREEPPEPQPQPPASYPSAGAMLTESLNVVESTPTSQPVTTESIVTNSTTLEKQLSASMKQLAVSVSEAASNVTPAQHYSTQHHRPKPAIVGQQNVYSHHSVPHHPAVYGASVYAPPVNSNASLAGSMPSVPTYPSSVTLTQYQPMINEYQTSASATVYGGSALYTAAPYAPYQQPQPKPQQAKDTTQYEPATPSSTTLTNTSTVQSSKGAPSTGSNTATAYASALYNSATYGYDEQLMRDQHMGGYYEVGYGVSGAREGTFGLGTAERFGRTGAASPQQVPAAALPPGYAYFYQPPPTTYQYGAVYPYGGGSNVGGVGAVNAAAAGKLSSYGPQQPPYDADSYKPAGPYNANATKTAGGAATDLTGNMYAKTHVALNKVNSYEKAGFHSGTPPPFGAGSHLYIPAGPHHHPHHVQHQMDVRVNSSHNRRQESQGGRSAATKPPASKPAYSQSYWAPN